MEYKGTGQLGQNLWKKLRMECEETEEGTYRINLWNKQGIEKKFLYWEET